MNIWPYRSGYEYVTEEDWVLETDISPPRPLKTDFIEMAAGGKMTLKKYYAWNGPSGPTIKTKTAVRATAFHDAFYQLCRMGMLPAYYRKKADILMYDILINAGMNRIRAWLWLKMVRAFASKAAKVGTEPPVLYAP